MEKISDQTDFLMVVISRIEIETQDISLILQTLTKTLEDAQTMKYFHERVEIGVGGYDDDSRELWEIPEVRSFIRILDDSFPYWFYFLNKMGGGLKFITFCCIKTSRVANGLVEIDPYSMEQFYNKHFIAMNIICDKIGMTDEENRQLTERVISYFT